MTPPAPLARLRPRARLWVKLALFGALGVVLTHSIHVAIASRVADAALTEQQAALGRTVARLVAREVAEAVLVNDVLAVHDLVASAARSEPVAYCLVLREGRVLASSFDDATPPALLGLRAAGDLAPVVVLGGGARFLDVEEPVNGTSGASVRVGTKLDVVDRTRKHLARVLGVLALSLIGAGVGAALAVGRSLAKPVGDLLRATDGFDPAAPLPAVAPRGTDEIAEVTERFNRMMVRLKAAHDEQARARQRAVETERMAALGLLVGGVAHEVNNPLAGLKNCLRRLQRNDLGPDRRTEYLELMQEGLDRIEDIVRRLLDYGRPRPLALGEVPLAALATEGARLLLPARRRRSVTYAPDTDGPLGAARVHADPKQIAQALMNLLLNAAYVTPPGGAVRLTLRERDGQLGLAVADEGPGIPEAIRDRILLPFFSTKPEGEGTGLGLSVTRTIVDAHGGALTFEFPDGGGTVATIWLRRAG